jgi:hypothetical protein
LKSVSELLVKEDSKVPKDTKIYDSNMIEKAINLILKNKLSIRAASKLFKMPFSLLRNKSISAKRSVDDVNENSQNGI